MASRIFSWFLNGTSCAVQKSVETLHLSHLQWADDSVESKKVVGKRVCVSVCLSVCSVPGRAHGPGIGHARPRRRRLFLRRRRPVLPHTTVVLTRNSLPEITEIVCVTTYSAAHWPKAAERSDGGPAP
jgi:hypothetical protein